METVIKDIRYGARTLAKKPVFTLLALLSLALGIGANTAIYSIVYSVLLRPLPVNEPERLVAVTSDSLSYPAYTDFRDQNELFSGLAGFSERQMSFTTGGQPLVISGGVVSGNYFDVLGVGAVRGRTLSSEEDQASAEPAAVLSYNLWQTSFGADAGVVGKSLNINGQPFTIIGVAPRDFRGTRLTTAPDLWIPIAMWPRVATGSYRQLSLDKRGWSWLSVVGRLKPDVTREEAEAHLTVLARQQAAAFSRSTPNNFSVKLEPLTTSLVETKSRDDFIRFLTILMAVVAIALVISCANVANLLLVRAVGRRKEIAIRLAMGASRRRIIRQLLTESVLLSIAGGAIGLLVAVWAIDLMKSYELPGGVALGKLGLRLSAEVLGFTFGLSLVTGIIFGLAPALGASKPDIIPSLKDQVTAQGVSRSLLRSALVTSQVALCLILLVGAGLFVRSLGNAVAINPGFNPDNVALASFNLGLQGYDEARAAQFYQQLTERVSSLSGVESVSFATLVPVSALGNRESFKIEGYRAEPGEKLVVDVNSVGANYFRTMQIPIVRGREFNSQDVAGAPPVVVISEAMAQRYWPGENAVGKQISILQIDAIIVGVVKDSKYQALRELPKPYLYMPTVQLIKQAGLATVTLIARTKGEHTNVLANLQREVVEIDPSLPLFGTKTLRDHIGDLLIAQRFGVTLFGMFGLLVMTLSVAGIYGVVAYSVSQRRHEIGIRLALGAQTSDILKLVLGRGLIPVFVGVGVGLVAAFVITRFLTSFLYGVSATDTATFIVASLVLAGVALGASFVPAHRATKVDPMVALRYE